MVTPLLLIAIAVAGIVPATSLAVSGDADRIKSIPKYGPLLSKNYAGYVPASTDHKTQAFYWLIESENDPTSDPVVLWLNGGPGCSSLLGLFTENGPYVFRHDGVLEKNSFRWTTNATIIYIESPGGVGFSKAGSVAAWNDNITATYNYAALQAVFDRHPQFKTNDFYLSGESYAGHYVPQLAQKILNGPNKALGKRMKGFMVGNPCTGDIGCDAPDPTIEPFMRYHGFAPVDTRVGAPNFNSVPYDPYDLLVPTCVKKMDLLQTQRFTRLTHLNHLRRELLGMDVDGLPTPPAPYGPCASEYLTKWLNTADVKAAIHADSGINWNMCGNVRYAPQATGVVDIYQEIMNKTTWSIMIYSGTADSVVNFIQTEVVVGSMKRKLNSTAMEPWYYPDLYTAGEHQLGGFMVVYDRMTWVGVRDAGHMVPQFNPPAAKQLFTDFLANGRPPSSASQQ